MGADIHLYIEYVDNEDSSFSSTDSIYLFNEGELLIPRDYNLFAVLAGVRSYDEFLPLYPPRGFPDPASVDAINSFHINILDHESERLDEEDVMREMAEEWVKNRESYIRDSWIKKNGFVSDPNYHNPSWLYLKEIKKAFDHSPYKLKNMPKEIFVVLDILESFENNFGKESARILFWFDN